MKYEAFNKTIIKLIGGKENIRSVTHCVTRLRFQLKNKELADTEGIRNADGVIDVISNDVAYQIVIGTHVTDVYEELTSILELKEDAATKTHGKKNNQRVCARGPIRHRRNN